VATANPEGGTISVLLNDGGGSLSRIWTYPVLADPVHVVAGDLDGDGYADLVVGQPEQYYYDRVGANYLTQRAGIMRNLGDGQMSTATEIEPGSCLCVTHLGRANNDSALDIFTGNQVLVNDGHAGFSPGSTTGDEYCMWTPTVDDFNGDGLVDLAGISPFQDAVVVLLNQDGTGYSAGDRYAFAGSHYAGSVAAGDFDGDGDRDLAAGVSSLVIYPNLGNGLFGSPESFWAVCLDTLESGDVDGDGDVDLIGGCSYTAFGVVAYLNDGTGAFAERITFVPELGERIDAVRLADLDGNGRLDLLAGGSFGLAVALNPMEQ
jgi:hypothetical protein